MDGPGSGKACLCPSPGSRQARPLPIVHALFNRASSERVSETGGRLGGYLAVSPVFRKCAMARRAYPTDLTDAQWAILEHFVPRPRLGGAHPPMPAASWSTPCSRSYGAASPGVCYPTNTRRGRPSPTTSGAGGWMGAGSRSTPPCGNGCASRGVGSRPRVPRSSTASRSRRRQNGAPTPNRGRPVLD